VIVVNADCHLTEKSSKEGQGHYPSSKDNGLVKDKLDIEDNAYCSHIFTATLEETRHPECKNL
jgi:hypothetical protein